MHVLVADVLSALEYEWPIHYLGKRWVGKCQSFSHRIGKRDVDYQEIASKMCLMRILHPTAPLIRSGVLTIVQLPLSRVRSLDECTTWRQRYFYALHHADKLFFLHYTTV